MKLVSLDAHVDVPYDLDELKAHDTNTETLVEFLSAQGFNSALKRLGQKPVANNNNTDNSSVNDNFPDISDNTYTLIDDIDTLKEWLENSKRTGILSFDTETTSITPSKAELVGISIASTVGKAAYIPLQHKGEAVDLLGGGEDIKQIPMANALSVIKPYLEDPSILKIAQNAKYDWQMFAAHDIDVSPIDDTMMLSYVLEAGLHGHGMDELSQLYFDHKPIPFKEVAGTGKSQVTFDYVPLETALDYAAEKTGDWSTNVSILEDLAPANPIVQKILDHRGLSKLKSTYTDALQNQIEARTGRVHTSFSLAGTSTGRLASSDPNLQNIPIRTEAGRKIRTAFVAPTGKSIVAVDYSQVELRLIAEMADIPRLKKAFIDGHDIHAITASEVFGVPLDKMDGETRRKAKAINFGIIYGISGFGLAKQLGIETSEAAQYIKLYFQRFPELANFMEETKAFAHDNGYVETLYARRAHMRGINDKNHMIKSGAERAAINAPVQGTAADIMKRAMILIDRAIQDGDIDAKMLLQVHDELIFEIDDDKIESESIKIKDIMENIIDLDVPLIAEAGSAKNWSDAH